MDSTRLHDVCAFGVTALALAALARVFQLAIVTLLPMGLVFLGTADWSRPWTVARRLTVPVAAVATAFTLLLYFEGL